jgi:hypothetical protein
MAVSSVATMSCIMVSGLPEVFGGGDGGGGDTMWMAFLGGHGMGDSSPKVIRLHFSVCRWLGGAVAASGSFTGCAAVVVGFMISVRISFIMH